MSRAEWTRVHLIHNRPEPVMAKCHGDRPHAARGKCRACLDAYLREQRRIERLAMVTA